MQNSWVRRRWADFRTGHSIYLIFLLSFSNFVLIFYRLLIEQIPILNDILPNLLVFGVAFILIYIPIAILIGLWHRRTQIRIETDLVLRNNPFMAKNFRMILDIIEGRADKEEVEKYRDLLRNIEKGNEGRNI